MKCKSGDEMPASKIIDYIQSRLYAEQPPPIDIQIKKSKNIDKTIEHLRSRLKSSYEPINRDDYHRSSILPEGQHHYAPGVGHYHNSIDPKGI